METVFFIGAIVGILAGTVSLVYFFTGKRTIIEMMHPVKNASPSDTISKNINRKEAVSNDSNSKDSIYAKPTDIKTANYPLALKYVIGKTREISKENHDESYKKPSEVGANIQIDPSSDKNVRSSFTDTRDGIVYRTVKIGGMEWFAENFRHKTLKSTVYEGDENHYQKKYGRLYPWEDAVEYAPPGWSLPNQEQFLALFDAFGGIKTAGNSLLEGGKSGLNIPLGGMCIGSRTEWRDRITKACLWADIIYGSASKYVLINKNGEIIVDGSARNNGFSVRYVRRSAD